MNYVSLYEREYVSRASKHQAETKERFTRDGFRDYKCLRGSSLMGFFMGFYAGFYASFYAREWRYLAELQRKRGVSVEVSFEISQQISTDVS